MTNTIWIPGIPAPQGSKRHVGNGILIESSKRVGPWRAVVALTVGEQTTTVLDGPVRIELQFVMPRPKATPKRSTPPAVKKPDLDKLTRAVLDAITGVSYRDDSQVVDLLASKRIAELGEPPGLSLTVEGAFCHCGGRAEIAGMCSPCKYSAHETCPCSIHKETP